MWKTDKNNMLLVIGLWICFVIISLLSGILYNLVTTPNLIDQKDVVLEETEVKEDLNITVFDDERCIECDTQSVVDQLKNDLPYANITMVDFKEDGVAETLKTKGINMLPYVVLDRNNINDNIDSYLQKLPDNTYGLYIGGNFPSLPIDMDVVKSEIYSNSIFKWNKDAKITWIEYSDLECPFCARFNNSGITDILLDKYEGKLNKTMNHFPLNFHANAMNAAQWLECVYKESDSETFYTVLSESFKKYDNNNFNLNGFYELVNEKTGIEVETIKSCVDSNEFATKVNTQMELGRTLFGITWTPWNVIINNETGEYRIVSGAVPTATLDLLIQDLLK